MEDLHTQHEDVTGDASRAASAYLTIALVAAQKATDTRTRRLDRRADTDTLTAAELARPSGPVAIGGPADPTRADGLAAERSAYEAMLGRDQGRRAGGSTALRAWLASQSLTDDDAGLVANRAEARLRALHPDAMARYDRLRDRLDPVHAMREVTPLITTEQQLLDHVSRASDAGSALTAPAAVQTAQDISPVVAAAAHIRYAHLVRDVLEVDLAVAVLRDDAWPALATALEQADQAGVDAGQLLRDVAAQRELGSAKHPAHVLNFRLEHRTITAADVVASNFPTALTDAPLPREIASERTAAELVDTRSARELAGDATPTPAVANADGDRVTHVNEFVAGGHFNPPPEPVQEDNPRDQVAAGPAVEIAAHSYPVTLEQVSASQAKMANAGASAKAAAAAARPGPSATLHC